MSTLPTTIPAICLGLLLVATGYSESAAIVLPVTLTHVEEAYCLDKAVTPPKVTKRMLPPGTIVRVEQVRDNRMYFRHDDRLFSISIDPEHGRGADYQTAVEAAKKPQFKIDAIRPDGFISKQSKHIGLTKEKFSEIVVPGSKYIVVDPSELTTGDYWQGDLAVLGIYTNTTAKTQIKKYKGTPAPATDQTAPGRTPGR